MALSLSPRTWSIRVKGVVLAIGYLLALSAVYGAFTIYLLRRETSQAHDRFQQTARILADELDTYVASGTQRLQTVAQLPGLAYGLQTIEEARREGYIPPWTTLHYLFFKSPLFTGGVFLLNRSGEVLWTEPPGLAWLHQGFSDLAPIAKIYQTRSAGISGMLAGDRLLAQPHVVIGVPIQNGNGDVQGILAGVIDLTASEFGSILDAVATSEGRFAEVLDQDGVALVATDATRRFHAVEPLPTDGDDTMLAVAALAHAPWRVIAGQPRSLAMAEVVRFQRALWGIGEVLLVLAGLVATPILNGFVRSVKQLTDAAETMTRGDLSQPVLVGERRDEIATLARAFEQMRVELGRSRHSLEQRLGEREKLIQMLVNSNEELHAAQARLVEAERFAAIGELSAAVAHGIRNPVAGIKAAAQLASLDLAAQDPLSQNIADIIAEADKLESRIKALLNFAKPFEPHFAPCRIEAIVADAVTSLHNQLAAQNIEVMVALPPGLPEVELDYAQIEQVLLALLSNAVEAIPTGGSIVIAGGLVNDGTCLRIEIVDDGPGITATQLEGVFKLFFTTKSNGTGLGLAVARKIVERHGGTIVVDSTIGKGARFTIELPLSHPASTAAFGTTPAERSIQT